MQHIEGSDREQMFMLRGLHPHNETIANFRKDNSNAFHYLEIKVLHN